ARDMEEPRPVRERIDRRLNRFRVLKVRARLVRSVRDLCRDAEAATEVDDRPKSVAEVVTELGRDQLARLRRVRLELPETAGDAVRPSGGLEVGAGRAERGRARAKSATLSGEAADVGAF